MSRCFPYPPPGYAVSRANKDALIESMKEKERAKDKEQRKQDKKREKKERKKEKKERKKEKKEKKDKSNEKSDISDAVPGHIGEKLWANTKNEVLLKGLEAEPDQLERSSLTEEHGHAVCSNPPSCSSDSTENSNKRKRQSSPQDVNHVHGKIFRIRLSKKPDDCKSSANEQQQLCSTSGRAHFLSTHKKQDSLPTLNEPSKSGQTSSQRIDEGQIQSTSQRIKTAVAMGQPEAPPVKRAAMTPMEKMELQYKNLFENWAPPQLQDAASLPDDLGWLFQGKKQDKSTERKPISGNASLPSCSGSQALWPHAQYLQEVDVYALPFTVPF